MILEHRLVVGAGLTSDSFGHYIAHFATSRDNASGECVQNEYLCVCVCVCVCVCAGEKYSKLSDMNQRQYACRQVVTSNYVSQVTDYLTL